MKFYLVIITLASVLVFSNIYPATAQSPSCQCAERQRSSGALDQETCEAGGCLTTGPGTWQGGVCICAPGKTLVDGVDTIEECQANDAACEGFTGGTWGLPETENATTTPAPAIPRLVNPLGVGMTFQHLIGRVIKAVLGISGSLALVIFVWGGFTWLTSGGSPDKIDKGKRMLVWATLGLALIFGAYAITNFVIEAVTGATGA